MTKETPKISHTKAYWVLQGFGWGIYFILNQIIFLSILDFKQSALLNIFLVGVGFSLSHLFRSLIHHQNWKSLPIGRLVAKVLLASSVIGLIWALITIPFNLYVLGGNEEATASKPEDFNALMSILLLTINYGITIFGWALIYFSYHFFSQYKQTEVEKWKLEAAVKDAELMALKAQINPHFIFNSLNNIRSLIIEDAEKARDMITHLSDLLRYAIHFSNQETVTLRRELEVVQNYLDLESIQFEERMNYSINADTDCLDVKIPPMVIQLLVENAVKHSLSLLKAGGEICISAKKREGEMVVEVKNTGQLKTNVNGAGIGLKNATERLQILFGKRSNLTVNNSSDNNVTAKFTVPLN
jgi:two-component system LytT family sensor kinase